MQELGFHSIQIEAYDRVVLNVGSKFEVKGDMQVTDGVLMLASENSSISLTIPKTHLKKVEISSSISSIECNGIDADSIEISAYDRIKVSGVKAGEIYLGSQISSIVIDSSEFGTAKIEAYDRVKASMADFGEIGISSQISSVKFEFLKNDIVYTEAESGISDVYVKGLFCGDKKCKHKLYISAYDRVDLISKGE